MRLPWRKKACDVEARAAIEEAHGRAEKTWSILGQEAVMAEQYKHQRQSNGFVEMFATVLTHGRGNA